VTLLLICNVSRAPASLNAAIMTEEVGVLAKHGATYEFIAGELPAPTTQPTRSLPIMSEGYTPQNVRIAPGMVARFAKEMAQATRLRLQFTDAWHQLRTVTFSFGDPKVLNTMISPCVL
jgi:hypothetical protein